MSYQDTRDQLAGFRKQIFEIREKMHAVQAEIEPQEVEDYTFTTMDGESTSLADLFGEKDDLIVIHNMGPSCRYCTLWADGFNGIYDHLANRASFVLTTPEEPAKQKAFAEKRGWRFPILSHQGTTFAADMGYTGEHGFEPGISVFQKRNGKVVRVSDSEMGPYDDFCAIWHFLRMIPEGPNGWEPQYKY